MQAFFNTNNGKGKGSSLTNKELISNFKKIKNSYLIAAWSEKANLNVIEFAKL